MATRSFSKVRGSRFKPLAVAAAMTPALMAVAHASALPVFGGPTFNGSTGFVEATISAAPDASIINNGFAIGEAIWRTPSVLDGGSRPVSWTPAPSWNSYATSPPSSSGFNSGTARALNAAGVAVGEAQVYSGATYLGRRALRWGDSASQLENLGASSTGFANTLAIGINGAGLTVGTASKYNGAGVLLGMRAVRWLGNSASVQELPALNPQAGTAYLNAGAVDVNDSGIAVGYSETYSGGENLGYRATRWNAAGAIVQLGVLGTDADGKTQAEAIGVNNAGVVVGITNKYDANNTILGRRAVRYGPNGTFAFELDVLGTTVPGYSSATVRSVSDHGMILGASNKYLFGAPIGTRAVYWMTNGVTANELPNLGTNAGVTDGLANSSNVFGVIAGWSDKYTNNSLVGRRAVIWTTEGADAAIDLNTLLPSQSGWTLTETVGISDTGFVSGIGVFDPDGPGGLGSYTRHFTMLLPQAGSYGRGDGNFDTAVNFADLLLLAKNYGKSNAGQINVADFNLDGFTNFTDLLALAKNYGETFSGSLEGDWALAQSMVPEPVSGLIVGCSSLLLRRRRGA